MGVKGLLRFINTLTKDAIVERHLSYYKNRRVGIDTSIYMYRYQMDGNNFIDEFLKMILQLKKFQIDIYFLFDGKLGHPSIPLFLHLTIHLVHLMK
mgnify:CR=1 FL=1